MSDLATGDIEAKGIAPQPDFKSAASGAPTPAKPVLTIAVKPDVVTKIISQLDQIKGRTTDSKITTEQTSDGGTKYSFIDKRNNQPLAVMNKQGDGTTLTFYKSPEDLAKRIDSHFVSAKDIHDFIKDYSIPATQASLMQPGAPKS